MNGSVVGFWIGLLVWFSPLLAGTVAAQGMGAGQGGALEEVPHRPPPAALTEAATPRAYAEVMPHFVGGEQAMLAFFQKRLTYSSDAIAHLTAGIIFVSLDADAQGRILDPQIVKGVGYGLDEEALRLVRLMPWWEPGKTQGKAVPVQCTLPVRFRIGDGGSQ
ncbi:MAG: hypothetical protein NVS3B25_15380 [Hymenobacter sp.]